MGFLPSSSLLKNCYSGFYLIWSSQRIKLFRKKNKKTSLDWTYIFFYPSNNLVLYLQVDYDLTSNRTKVEELKKGPYKQIT